MEPDLRNRTKLCIEKSIRRSDVVLYLYQEIVVFDFWLGSKSAPSYVAM